MTDTELWGAARMWLWLVLTATTIALPALFRGFLRRDTGLQYERNFWVQRAPQFAIALNLFGLSASFEAIELFLGTGEPAFGKVFFQAWAPYLPALSLALVVPAGIAGTIAWCGVVLSAFGLVFLVGGWYSLGTAFSPDAELLREHVLQQGGMFRYVMHPVYAGIIHFLLGSAVVGLSPLCGAFTVGVVAPLLLQRAKHEEALLTERFGVAYGEFARQRCWRRFVPTFVPFGISGRSPTGRCSGRSLCSRR